MNNLKRVLSLALSTVMLVGMMAMGASAAEFTDAETIQHDEAVNILVALKVINGKPDGSFDPEGNVTRGEMAKMIAVAMNGGNDANTGVKSTPTFTDIDNHWAESFIEYCSDLGIISGRGDGTFDPDGNVTGLEATKMVLTALGYDATAYRLTGPSWAVRTDELAKAAKPSLYEDLVGTVSMAAVATRDTAAQVIWNGLQNQTRKVTPSTNTSTGETTWSYGEGEGKMIEERYSADIKTGTYVGNANTGLGEKGEIAVSKSTGGAPYTFPSDMDISNIGEEVKVIYKDGKGGSKGAPDKHDTIYGVFNTGKTEVIEVTRADVKAGDDSPKAANKIKLGSTEYAIADPDAGDTLVEFNYNSGNRSVAETGTLAEAKAAFEALKADQNGSAIKFVCNADGEITTAYVVDSKIAAVTATNSSKITMNNSVGSITFADNDVAEDVKKGDVVVVTTLYKAKATDDDAFTIVKKAETVTGEVAGYKANDNVKVDGTTYKIFEKRNPLALTAMPDADKVVNSFNTGDNTYIEEEVVLYLLNGYVAAAEQISESATNYSLITEVKTSSTAGSTFGSLQLQVMDGEGTKSIISVSEDSTKYRDQTAVNSANYRVGDIITYTLDKNNEADVKIEAMVDYSGTATYNDSTKTFNGTVTTGDCVVFVQTKALKNMEDKAGQDDKDSAVLTGASYKAYTVRNLKGFTASYTGMTKVTNGDGKVVAAFANQGLGKDPAGATSNTVYGIVSAADGKIKDYYSYKVQSNGEEYVVNSKDSGIAKGSLVFFDLTSDNNYGTGDVKVLSAGYNLGGTAAQAVYAKELDGMDALTFYTSKTGTAGDYKGASQKTLALDGDAAIIGVDKDNSESSAEASVAPFDPVTGYKNLLIVTQKDNDGVTDIIVAIFVETSNECDVMSNGVAVTPSDIKSMPDGTYTTTGNVNEISDQPAKNLVFFKYTSTATTQTYTLTMKKGDVTYTETTDDSYSSAAGHYFVIDVKGATSTGSFAGTGAPVDGKFTAGEWSVEIKGADNTVVLSDVLTVK